MPHLTTTPNGTPVDLDTARGQYEYLGEFLVSRGAPSTTLGLLTQLYRQAAAADQPKPDHPGYNCGHCRDRGAIGSDGSRQECEYCGALEGVDGCPDADQPKPSCPEFPDNSKCAPIVEHGPVGILPLVIHDMKQRGEMGMKKYGRPLTANNGRDALRDAYEEAMDLCQYLRQAIEERGSDPAREGGGE